VARPYSQTTPSPAPAPVSPRFTPAQTLPQALPAAPLTAGANRPQRNSASAVTIASRQQDPLSSTDECAVPPPANNVNGPSPAENAMRDEIIAKAEVISSLDYFAMFEVSQEATADDINKAYFAIAKRLHPDKLPASLAAVKSQAAKIFSHISEAHKTLTDTKKRAEYMRLLKEGGASPDEQAQIQTVLEAVTFHQKAEFYFKRRDFAQAEAFAKSAVDADPSQGEYNGLYAWLRALRPENQTIEATRKLIGDLDGAIKSSPKSATLFFYRGTLHKRVGASRDAMKDFNECVDLQPGHVDAAREVRLFQMRGTLSSPPPAVGDAAPQSARTGPSSAKPVNTGGGILDKLFKR
jgi:curved DNA-binding protein CbpA